MSITHTLTLTCNDGGEVITKNIAVTAGSAIVIDETIPTPSTNLSVALAFVRAKLQSIYILSDKALTLYTNDLGSGSPQDTFVLVANEPVVWRLGDPAFAVADIFAGNVTSLYVTNASGAEAVLRIRGIVDPT